MTKMPKGYYVEWSGQWENQIRANKTLSLILPIVVVIIFCFIFHVPFNERGINQHDYSSLCFNWREFLWFIFMANLSVAVAVGFIALFGMAIETAMLMTIYLNEAMNKMVEKYGNTKRNHNRRNIETIYY
jgi:Cu(I)/Ag(I) efflux system membrane protein CusA/SilA